MSYRHAYLANLIMFIRQFRVTFDRLVSHNVSSLQELLNEICRPLLTYDGISAAAISDAIYYRRNMHNDSP
jgi:hypothetical protein